MTRARRLARIEARHPWRQLLDPDRDWRWLRHMTTAELRVLEILCTNPTGELPPDDHLVHALVSAGRAGWPVMPSRRSPTCPTTGSTARATSRRSAPVVNGDFRPSPT